MTRLRLCFVGPAASVTLRRWVDWFAARGHEATVLTVEPAEHAPERFRQIDVSLPSWPRKFGRLVSALRVALAVRGLDPDVLHIHYLRGLAWGLPLMGFHPCVVTPWGSDVLEEQGAFREWYSRRLTHQVLGRADLVTVHSAYMEGRVRSLFPDVRLLARIGWGVDLKLFRPGLDVGQLRRRWGITEDRRVILSPRLAQPFYNHDRIIGALPGVLKKVPGAVLIVTEQFADREYVAGLHQLVSDLGVSDSVKFVGSIPYADMPLWLNLAEAVVMVPGSDGMPNTLLEAMACGAVPLLNRLPQYAEIVAHGVNGFFVDPSGGELEEALIGVLSDAGLRERIARTNRATVHEVADQEQEMSCLEGWYFRLAEGSTASVQ